MSRQFPRKNLALGAHNAGWSPLIKTPQGQKLAKDLPTTRRSWRGKRVLQRYTFSDLMPIPPLELKQGHITNEGKTSIRKFLRESRQHKSSAGSETIRAVCKQDEVHKPDKCRIMSNQITNKHGLIIARSITLGFSENAQSYNNKWYIDRLFESLDSDYVIPRQRTKGISKKEVKSNDH